MTDSRDNVVDIPAGTNKLEAARSFFQSNVRCRVLFCILELHSDKSITDLSLLAKMDIEDTVQSLECLEILGYIKKTSTGYEQLTNKIHWLQNSNAAKTRALKEFLIPNLQIINEMLVSPTDPNHYSKCLVYNSNAELVLEFQQSIAEAITKFKEKSEACNPQSWDGVYTFSAVMTQFVKLD